MAEFYAFAGDVETGLHAFVAASSLASTTKDAKYPRQGSGPRAFPGNSSFPVPDPFGGSSPGKP